MTAPLTLQSEPYSEYGNISAQGIGKILGTPTHDRLGIAIRETVQNSWDARIKGSGGLRYRIELRHLKEDEQECMSAQIFRDLPPEEDTSYSIGKSLGRSPMRVLEISDWGTSGLGGPVRANHAVLDDELTDFIDFIRNIGSPRDKEFGGGTYGYGKSSLFVLSHCRTICVHSLAEYRGDLQHRFMASRLGEPVNSKSNGRLTGRHWWGREAEDGFIDPVTGPDAENLAMALGLPGRSRDRTGTTILIVDPDLEGKTIDQATNAIMKELLWSFWPKMVSVEGESPPMDFGVYLDGRHIPVPTLDQYPPLGLFRDAMIALKQNAASVVPIDCQRPQKRLGLLSVSTGAHEPRMILDTNGNDDSGSAEVDRKCSHIALMRPAELVVKYLEGPKIPSDMVEYAGVFICDAEVEPCFAAAEPPAHDEWNPEYLTGNEKTFVRTALRKIKDELNSKFTAPGPSGSGRQEEIPLGIIADALGGILVGSTGSRLGGSTEGGKGNGSGQSGSSRGYRVSTPQLHEYRVIGDNPCAVFSFEINNSSGDDVVLNAKPAVALEGGSATDSPEGVMPPKVIAWYSPAGEEVGSSGSLTVPPGIEDTFLVAIRIPDNCAIILQMDSEQKA